MQQVFNVRGISIFIQLYICTFGEPENRTALELYSRTSSHLQLPGDKIKKWLPEAPELWQWANSKHGSEKMQRLK